MAYLAAEGLVDVARALGPIAGRNRIVYDPSVVNSYDVESGDPNQPIRLRRPYYGQDISKTGAIVMVDEAHKKGKKK